MYSAKRFLLVAMVVSLCSCSDSSDSKRLDAIQPVTGGADTLLTGGNTANGGTGPLSTGGAEKQTTGGTGGAPIDSGTLDGQTQTTDGVSSREGGVISDSAVRPDTAVIGDAMVEDGQIDQPCEIDLEPQPEDNECTAPLKPGDDRRCDFTYNGAQRDFYIYTPTSYNPCEPASLIVDCHGMSETAEVHIGVDTFYPDTPSGYGSSWRAAVYGDNAIVVTPQGVGNAWSAGTDVGFLNEVATMVEQIANVDPEKVYITGISMGGMITYATGCADTNRWRGLVGVAALNSGAASCQGIARPVPFLAFHAVGDMLTNYQTDRDLAGHIASLNNCQNGPYDSKVFGGPSSDADPVCYETPPTARIDAPDPSNIPLIPCPSDRPATTCVTWDQCDEGVEVMFCTVNADTQTLGGHILYTNDTGLSLGATGWAFLKKFQK